MTHTYEYEYTDTFGGEANYCWVKRGTVSMPDLTYYGYDGYSNYTKASKTFNRELMKKVKAELGLTGVRGRVYYYGDVIEFRPHGLLTVLFITYKDQ